jgi:patatin-like phospholipase/acyl hydrolase
MGLQPQQMLQFYRERGPVIFPSMRFHRKWQRELRRAFKPKFSQDALLQELNRAYCIPPVSTAAA